MYKVWDNIGWRGEDEHYDHEDLKKAYHEGKRDGWREAMEEVGYGERDDYGERGGYGQRGDYGGYGQRGNYGEREHNGYGNRASGYPQPDRSTYDVYGERRGVKGTGPYSRMPR